MIFVFGGAFQGKLQFVRENILKENGDNIFVFGYDDLENRIKSFDELTSLVREKCLSHKVVSGFEELAYFAANKSFDILDIITTSFEGIDRSRIGTLISCDISSGIVPMDPVLRKWREETGRLMSYLSSESQRVYRVFCGIGTRLK